MRDVVRRAAGCCAIGFEGQAASADVRALLREFAVGAVLLRQRNVVAPEQLAELVRELQAEARDAGLREPLLILAEQEPAAPLGEPWVPWPPVLEIRETQDAELARRSGGRLASVLHFCGVRLALTPTMDVDTNGTAKLAFGDDPERVGRMGVAVIEGVQAGGVAACARDFPGQGEVLRDGAGGLPFAEQSRSRLEDVELRPFRRACDAGVASVRVAHLLVRELDDTSAATLSPAVVDGVLRKELHFDGVVVTADLTEPALARRVPADRAVVAAARAGCDLFCLHDGPNAQVAGIEGLVRAVESADVPFKQTETAERRLRTLKERFLLGYRDPDPRLARETARGGATERLGA